MVLVRGDSVLFCLSQLYPGCIYMTVPLLLDPSSLDMITHLPQLLLKSSRFVTLQLFIIKYFAAIAN